MGATRRRNLEQLYSGPQVLEVPLYSVFEALNIEEAVRCELGRMLTYELNGTTVICNREIPGITGGALDSAEADPGPLLLQGDHGPVDYRNIVITPARTAR